MPQYFTGAVFSLINYAFVKLSFFCHFLRVSFVGNLSSYLAHSIVVTVILPTVQNFRSNSNFLINSLELTTAYL